MLDTRTRIESWFSALGGLTVRFRWLTLSVCLGITIILALQTDRLTVDTSNESFFHATDPALINYYDFRERFGNDEYILITLEPDNVFSPAFLNTLKRMHRRLAEKVPHVDDIRSLATARNTFARGDTLIVEDMLRTVPTDERGLADLQRRVMNNPLLIGSVIDDNASLVAIAIQPLAFVGAQVSGSPEDILAGFDDPSLAFASANTRITPAHLAKMVRATESIVDEFSDENISINITGSPVFIEFLNRAITEDMARMVPLSLLLVMGFLLLLFRRIIGVLAPMIVVVLSVAATLGFMAAAGLAITNITQIIPTFLIVVGVADSVHILAIFFRRYNEHGDKPNAIRQAMAHSGLAILMTSLTTAVGLASFIIADAKVISELGIVAPVGVLFAFFYTVTFLPALLAVVPLRRGRPLPTGESRADRMLTALANFTIRRAWVIIAFGVVILAVSIIGIMQVRLSHSAISWFPEDAEVRTVAEMVDERLGGGISLELLIDTGQENGLYDPTVLQRLDAVARWAENQSDGPARIAKAVSVADVVKEINQALHGGDPAFSTIPDDRDLVAQELLLFESSGTDDLDDVVDPALQTARLTLTIPNGDVVKYLALVRRIINRIESDFPEAEVTATGLISLFIGIIGNLITTMLKSYGIALVIITLLMVLLIGRLGTGLVAMIPNLLPLAAVLGLMGLTGITINLSTVIVGSIAMGIVVDDTIHFFHNYRRYRDATGSSEEAVRLTMMGTGRAIIITSLVLAAGFYIYVFATMELSVEYGIITGSAVVFALVADLLVAPALMIVLHRDKTP